MPWRMRPSLTWSKETSTTSSGRSAIHSRSRPAAQRLGSPEPRSPVSYGASLATSSRFSFARKPEVCPTTRSSPSSYRPRINEPTVPSSFPGRQPDDHAVRGAHALHLHHPLALAGPVGSIELLCDHALARFEPWRCLCEAPLHGRQLDRARGGLLAPSEAGEQRLESLAPVDEGTVEELFASLGQEVEGAKQSRRSLGEHPHPRFRRVQPVLEGVELLVPVGSEDQELTIEHVARGREVELGEVPTQRLGPP